MNAYLPPDPPAYLPPPPYPPPAYEAAPLAGRGRHRALYAACGAIAVAGVAVGLGLAAGGTRIVSGSGSLGQASANSLLPRGSGGYGLPWGGNGSSGGGNGSSGGGASGQRATTEQEVGVVDVDTVLGYQGGAAAGTGMVLGSSGEVLTNNHVVDGATSIRVTVVSTGRTYQAKVVGTDPSDDVAVVQLSGASGLQTARLGDSRNVSVGDAVTGVGNAGGTGGTPSAASGVVTALNQPITATDESGADPEQLTGLIETSAKIQAGDSGGALYNSAGQVVGMDTAAATNGLLTAAGYAIPIDTAVQVADRIESATASTGTIHLGYPAFLGVSVAPYDAGGAAIVGVLNDGPAAKAGLSAGDVITRVGGVPVASATALQDALSGHRPGDSVSIAWVDPAGQTHHATVVLAQGPAD